MFSKLSDAFPVLHVRHTGNGGLLVLAVIFLTLLGGAPSLFFALLRTQVPGDAGSKVCKAAFRDKHSV